MAVRYIKTGWPDLGGCLSITSPEKVSPRPFMGELCLLLCGFSVLIVVTGKIDEKKGTKK